MTGKAQEQQVTHTLNSTDQLVFRNPCVIGSLVLFDGVNNVIESIQKVRYSKHLPTYPGDPQTVVNTADSSVKCFAMLYCKNDKKEILEV